VFEGYNAVSGTGLVDDANFFARGHAAGLRPERNGRLQPRPGPEVEDATSLRRHVLEQEACAFRAAPELVRPGEVALARTASADSSAGMAVM
jgi:hypothetical protein